MPSYLFVLLAAWVVACDAHGEQGETVIQGFVNAVRSARIGQAAFVLDVGANNGFWARSVMERVRGSSVSVAPVLFEPQEQYFPVLQQLAADWGGTFHAAAAWTRATNLSFYISHFKEASSLSEQLALTFSKPEENTRLRRVIVRTVDLARVLRSCWWRAKGGPIILKLDVEAAEYDLLPRLFMTGALCRCTFLLIEWHLNAMPPARRLRGMMLRNSFDEMLTRGCWKPPRLIVHDEDFLNNFGEALPELDVLAARYKMRESTPNKRPYATAASVIARRSHPQHEH
jgi:FkbM family methyltransferase